jgi:hypothetical protein
MFRFSKRARLAVLVGAIAVLASGCVVSRPPDAVRQIHDADAVLNAPGIVFNGTTNPFLAETVRAPGATTTSAVLRRNDAGGTPVTMAIPTAGVNSISSAVVGVTYLANTNVPVVLTTATDASGVVHTIVSTVAPNGSSVETQIEVPGTNLQPRSVASGANSIFVMGTETTASNKRDVTLRAIAANDYLGTLSLAWTKSFGSADDDVAIDIWAGSSSPYIGLLWKAPASTQPFVVTLLNASDGTLVWQQKVGGGGATPADFTNGAIAVSDPAGVAVGGVGGVQFLSLAGATVHVESVPGANVRDLDLNEQGFVATGTTRAALFNVQPAGGDDAFIAAFGPAYTLTWGHMLGTAGDETIGSSLFMGKTYVSGTTTGAFSGSVDSGGDGFYAAYSAPVPSRIQNLRVTHDGTQYTFTWDAPATDNGSPVIDYAITGVGASIVTTQRTATITASSPDALMYGRIVARNAIGNSPGVYLYQATAG